MELRTCKYCKQTFDIPGRSFSNHVRWCGKNPNTNALENVRLANRLIADKRFGIRAEFDVSCAKCGCQFTVSERENSFPSKSRYFCSRRCANTKEPTESTKRKIAESLKKLYPKKTLPEQVCIGCNIAFVPKIKGRIYCCNQCFRQHTRSEDEYLRYRSDCAFRFNVYDYPEEFDLSLIAQHGWYKAKNKGDNLDGVSRDHRVSIKYGWLNGVPPDKICHPANCQLMLHSSNFAKKDRCSLSISELFSEIEKWNLKYGAVGESPSRPF